MVSSPVQTTEVHPVSVDPSLACPGCSLQGLAGLEVLKEEIPSRLSSLEPALPLCSHWGWCSEAPLPPLSAAHCASCKMVACSSRLVRLLCSYLSFLLTPAETAGASITASSLWTCRAISLTWIISGGQGHTLTSSTLLARDRGYSPGNP